MPRIAVASADTIGATAGSRSYVNRPTTTPATMTSVVALWQVHASPRAAEIFGSRIIRTAPAPPAAP